MLPVGTAKREPGARMEGMASVRLNLVNNLITSRNLDMEDENQRVVASLRHSENS